jgi:hypothetical protein
VDWPLLHYFAERQEMKQKTAVRRIYDAINAREHVLAAELLAKYQRKFGHRKFTYWIRCMVKNGLWELECE